MSTYSVTLCVGVYLSVCVSDINIQCTLCVGVYLNACVSDVNTVLHFVLVFILVFV